MVREDRVCAAVAQGELVVVLEAFSTPFPGYYLYYPQRRHASPPLRALVDHLRRARRRAGEGPLTSVRRVARRTAEPKGARVTKWVYRPTSQSACPYDYECARELPNDSPFAPREAPAGRDAHHRPRAVRHGTGRVRGRLPVLANEAFASGLRASAAAVTAPPA